MLLAFLHQFKRFWIRPPAFAHPPLQYLAMASLGGVFLTVASFRRCNRLMTSAMSNSYRFPKLGRRGISVVVVVQLLASDQMPRVKYWWLDQAPQVAVAPVVAAHDDACGITGVHIICTPKQPSRRANNAKSISNSTHAITEKRL